MGAKAFGPHRLGHYAFLLGIFLAVVAALTSPYPGEKTMHAIRIVLVMLGLIVGFLNITAKEITEFLVAAVALIAAGLANNFLGELPMVGIYLQAVVGNIAVFVAPAAVVVALKAVKLLADR